jgi:hypothetical protein
MFEQRNEANAQIDHFPILLIFISGVPLKLRDYLFFYWLDLDCRQRFGPVVGRFVGDCKVNECAYDTKEAYAVTAKSDKY